MNKKIAIIGSGMVGIALAKGLLNHHYEVMIGSNNPDKQQQLKTTIGGAIQVGDFQQTAQFADHIILAVKGMYAFNALELCGTDNLKHKIVLDASNPIDESRAPVNGVLPFFTSLDKSLMETLQEQFTDTHFVKCFSCVGNAFMIDPDFNGEKPSMFICGNQDEAKVWTRNFLAEIGWETEDMGKVEAARAIEPLCMLWCIPGFLNNQWNHAFRLIKK